jgi:sterol desaturase/sphingolipid hydroxylase (fatty acid hydroxylase superfamily)
MNLSLEYIEAEVVVVCTSIWHKYWGPDGLSWLLFLGSIVLAAIVTYGHQLSTRGTIRGFMDYALPWSRLRHPSARADLFLWLARRMTSSLSIIPITITTATAGYAVNEALHHVTGLNHRPGAGVTPMLMVVFTVTMLIAYDLSYYIYHYLQHKVRFMWELHAVHHSAEVMIGITKDRIHPLDQFMNDLWNGIIPGMAYGIWLFICLDPAEVLVFGINVYVLRNLLMMDVVRHTHYAFSFGKFLDRFVLCPHAHQLHHSSAPQHRDKNFGLLLCVWDRMFGTMVDPRPGESFVFGIDERTADYHTLAGSFVIPVIRMAKALIPSRLEKPHGRATDDTGATGKAAL